MVSSSVSGPNSHSPRGTCGPRRGGGRSIEGHAIEAEAVEVKLVEPVAQVAEQKLAHFPAAVVEELGVPTGVVAARRRRGSTGWPVPSKSLSPSA